MTPKEIHDNFLSLKDYVYWYGGKGERCTETLLSKLSSLYPKIYTKNYISLCRKDIEKGSHCIDCSGLVCKCVGVSNIGSWNIHDQWEEMKDWISNGCVLWRSGHVGIFWNGKVLEAAGKSSGVDDHTIFKPDSWVKVFRPPTLSIDSSEEGWYWDGDGWWYRHTKGKGPETYYHTKYQVIDGVEYLFDSEGYVVTRKGKNLWT